MLPLLFLLVAGDTSGYWQQQVAYQITAVLDSNGGPPDQRSMRFGFKLMF